MQDTDETKKRISEIRAQENLPEPPPQAQKLDLNAQMSVPDMVKQVQRYIEAFQYNYTGKPFIRMNKSRGVSHIHNVSKQLINESLPIQCVEAVFLGTTLTSGINELTRVPLSFKSKFVKGTVHRHIVLAVKFEGKWGAIGISRRSCLMNKAIKFRSLSALVEEYRNSYEACYHKLLTLYIGLPLPHEKFVDHPIKWRATKIRLFNKPWDEVAEAVDNFAANMLKLYAYFAREGCLPSRQSLKPALSPQR
jgi:hypothetical protein